MAEIWHDGSGVADEHQIVMVGVQVEPFWAGRKPVHALDSCHDAESFFFDCSPAEMRAIEVALEERDRLVRLVLMI